MNINDSVLTRTEQAIYRLRSLYGQYGYTPYKMSKFEAYDLYVRNKNFLVSDHIITFTDHSGRLMALKPDVTLSIVKSAKSNANAVQKVYYNEHVYRVPKGGDGFKEIMQVGLECVGNVSGYNISEVVCLAAKSLSEFSKDYVLDISHLGIISAFLDRLGAEGQTRKAILSCMSEKNTHGIVELCAGEELDMAMTDTLCRLVNLYGDSEAVLPVLTDLIHESGGCGALALGDLFDRIHAVKAVLPEARIHIDFSVINNMSYYNGIVFRGFIPGIPTAVLSGGQYDLLLSRMGKSGGAVGFAIYLDRLEALDNVRPDYDVDTLILTGEASPAMILAKVEAHIQKGERVFAAKQIPTDITYRQLVRLDGKGGETIENK